MKKTLLLLSTALLLSNGIRAQLSVGPVGGFHFTGYTFRTEGHSQMNGAQKVLDLRAGAIADVPLDTRVHFQPGILYTTNGFYRQESSLPVSYFNIRAMEIPLFLTWHTGMKYQSHFFFSAGIFAAININGRVHMSYTDSAGNVTNTENVTVKMGTDSSAFARRLGAGVGINAGYQLKRGFFVRVHWQQGLKNLATEDNNQFRDVRITNYNYGLSLGWLFKTKTRKERREDAAKPKPSY